MPHSKTKFNNSWLKKKDSNGHLLEWWCKSHDSDKFKAVCKLCDKEIQVANNGCFVVKVQVGGDAGFSLCGG